MNEQLVVGIVDTGDKLVELAQAFAETYSFQKGEGLITVDIRDNKVRACMAGDADALAMGLYSAMDTLLENNCEHQVLAILTRMAERLYERRNNG